MSDIQTIVRLVERLEDKVDKRLDKVDTQLDDLSKTAAVNTAQLTENTKSLIEHIKRTNILEEEQRLLRAKTDDIKRVVDTVVSDTEFMVKFPKMLYQLGKWLGGIGALCTSLWFIFRLVARYMTE